MATTVRIIKKSWRTPTVIGGLLLLIGIVAITALAVGPYSIPFSNIFAPSNDSERAVLLLLRLPRIAMALLIGGALAMSGAVLQGLFRNPLASPSVLGVSSGAALGAVIAIYSGISVLHAFILPASAFAGALLIIVLVQLLALVGSPSGGPSRVLLLGLAMGTLASALISLFLVTLSNPLSQRQILFWLAGGLFNSSWDNFLVALGPILIGTVLMLYYARDINLLMMGDTEARTLGGDVTHVRRILIFATSLVTGTAVAFSGVIGFVGLIVPHLMRLIVGSNNRVLIPLSALAGGAFLLIADTIARTIVSPAEINVGIVTAIVGTPFFIFLLTRKNAHTHS